MNDDKKFIEIEHHDMAVLYACQAILKLIEELPDGPLTEELTMLADTQGTILAHKIQNSHYGTQYLKEFCEHCSAIAGLSENANDEAIA